MNNLDRMAIGKRNMKKITLNSILELIHPRTCANFNQSHSIPFAATGIKMEIKPMPTATLASIVDALVYSFTNKTQAITRNPVTITRILLYLS